MALNSLLSYFTHHEGIEFILSDKLEFFCAGENFEKVICKNCQSNIFDWFVCVVLKQEFRTARDLIVVFPCCNSEGSLLDLTYIRPFGFACFGLTVCEGGIDEEGIYELSESELLKLEGIVGYKLRVIWSGH
ncbi:MAG: hypothetical protein C0507_17295 [Cyanobacteria bacterium PR.3.49]|nr:hypothetical protein [Cyanobacteria bacterium PR.3.49]